MGFLQDVRRGAKVVAKEAETRTQMARKHAESANLRSALDDVHAEVGREVLAEMRARPEAASIPVGERLKALLDEAARLTAERERIRAELDRLRAGSVFSREGGGDGDGAPRA